MGARNLGAWVSASSGFLLNLSLGTAEKASHDLGVHIHNMIDGVAISLS